MRGPNTPNASTSPATPPISPIRAYCVQRKGSKRGSRSRAAGAHPNWKRAFHHAAGMSAPEVWLALAALQARARRAVPTKIALAQSFPHRIRARKRSLKKFGACDLLHTQSAAGGLFSHRKLEGSMHKLGVLMMVAFAIVGGALAITTLYDQPAKANARARMDLSQMMTSAKNLPVTHYDDYSVVFN